MNSLWTWASIVGLSMTPSLVLGPPIAIGVGFEAHFKPWILIPVVSTASFVEGLVLAWLAGESTRIGFIGKWVSRLHTPRAMAFAGRWGIWGGLTIGRAIVGQEPILVALRWLGTDMRKIWVPLAISSTLFAILYYAITWAGLDKLAHI